MAPRAPDPARHRVAPGEAAGLTGRDPAEAGGLRRGPGVEKELARQRTRIAALQRRLYAEGRRGLLVVLQAMDTGGKDGTVRGVFSGVNPQGCRVISLGAPSREELAHDFLWRCHRHTPARGTIAVFNRSHYEDVLVVRVKGLVPEPVWRARYDAINDFERLLTQEGTVVLKLFLHVSRAEQRRRLESRLADPEKHWKLDEADLRERLRWDEYERAYEEAITRCSTAEAPWYVVPADRKWYRNLVVARVVADTLEAMDPRFPPAPPGLERLVVPD